MRYLTVRTENLSKAYGQSPSLLKWLGRKKAIPVYALQDLSLDIEPAEVFGLLGPAQAGKTTFLRLILQLIQPTRGDIYLFGQDVRRHPLALRQRVGYAPAVFRPFDRQKAHTFLQSLAPSRKNTPWNTIQDLADRLQLDLSQSIHAMSRSERQKLNLVQACMYRPELLLLDEPTYWLEPEDRQALHRLIVDLRNEGSTVVLATRSLVEIERNCDRVAVLNKGRLAGLERVICFKNHLLRSFEIRFAEQVPAEAFSAIPNLENISLDRTTLRCTVKGDPDQLIKAAGQYHVIDLISRASPLEDLVQSYYGAGSYAV